MLLCDPLNHAAGEVKASASSRLGLLLSDNVVTTYKPCSFESKGIKKRVMGSS